MTVRAMVMSGPRSMELIELPYPKCPEDGAVVQVTANGICGSDWALWSGEQQRPGGRPAPFPMVPGHEPVGRVVEISASAEQRWGVKVGDRIVVESKARCGSCPNCMSGAGACRQPIIYSLVSVHDSPGLWGGLADYMTLVAGSNVFRVPDHVSDDDATMFNPLGNAYYWVAEAGAVQPEDRVLILGSGQRGLCCAVAARESGAGQVMITGLSRDAEKLALAPRFGASHCLDVDRVDTVEAVREYTDGHGVDLVIDTVPGAVAPLHAAVEVLRPGGRLVLAGVRGADAGSFPLEQFRVKQLSMVGVSGVTTSSVQRAVTTIAEGSYPFRELHTHIFDLADAESAIRALGDLDDVAHERVPIHVIVKP
ncbi:L-threonine 3-dehydrogenase [Mycolicibacterium rhodesiae JS60]|nr:L-threonine 3-dehydrogenase [Mycolicibacterium rhodesiae JS60]